MYTYLAFGLIYSIFSFVISQNRQVGQIVVVRNGIRATMTANIPENSVGRFVGTILFWPFMLARLIFVLIVISSKIGLDRNVIQFLLFGGNR